MTHDVSASDFTVVIPARFASSRLPGKPLADIGGQPMVQHVYQRALASDASKVIVATDDERIMKAVQDFGGEVCMTLAGHPSGTDRLQEVARIYGLADDEIVVNVQGDEPLIPPAVINQVAANLRASPLAGAATLSSALLNIDQMFDPNVVKVVSDAKGYALYFSRAPIPWARNDFAAGQRTLPANICFQRHIGIYAYRVGLLNQYVTWGRQPCGAAGIPGAVAPDVQWTAYSCGRSSSHPSPRRGYGTGFTGGARLACCTRR